MAVSPEDLKNWADGGDISYSIGGATIGFNYDWQERAIAARKASHDIRGWINIKPTLSQRPNGCTGTGLNNNSPDFLGGATLSFRF